MTEHSLFSLEALKAAERLVYSAMLPTPQYAWPRLEQLTGVRVWVKHENHTPIGAFKIRGGLVYMDALRRGDGRIHGVVSATRGNHGQSIALSAARAGLSATIYVPHGNSRDKSAAMRALGASLIEHGRDFDEARAAAERAAADRGLHYVHSFHPWLVTGVATYALELFNAVEALDAVYVPIGMGSGVCAVATVRDLLGLKTEVVGVVAKNAPAVAHSLARGQVVSSGSAATFADGMAVREPHPQAIEQMRRGVARVVAVSEEELADAARMMFDATHQVCEGAGAAGFAALFSERQRNAGKRVAVILSGGNIDRDKFRQLLSGEVPAP